MKYNQNHKIVQITSRTLIIGVDIAKFAHVARAQDFRGLEFGMPHHFGNTSPDFEGFLDWIQQFDEETQYGEDHCRNGANGALL